MRVTNTVSTLATLPEGELIARAIGNEEAAVRAIIQAHNRALFRLARSIVPGDDEAEDVVQESYIRAFAGLSDFRGEAGLRTWLSRIVLNEALGRIRRRKPMLGLEVLDTLGPGCVIPFPFVRSAPDPERIAARQEIRVVLERAIDDLAPAFRTVLVARLVEGLSVEETADILGLKLATVKTRLHRARRLLRAALERRFGAVLNDAFPFDGARCQRMADQVVARLAALR